MLACPQRDPPHLLACMGAVQASSTGPYCPLNPRHNTTRVIDAPRSPLSWSRESNAILATEARVALMRDRQVYWPIHVLTDQATSGHYYLIALKAVDEGEEPTATGARAITLQFSQDTAEAFTANREVQRDPLAAARGTLAFLNQASHPRQGRVVQGHHADGCSRLHAPTADHAATQHGRVRTRRL